MKLSKNNLFTKLYIWFYAKKEEDNLPNNLCPYFWSLVFAIIVSPIYALLLLPLGIAQKFSLLKKKEERNKWLDDNRHKDATITHLLLFVTASIICAFIHFFSETVSKIVEILSIFGYTFLVGLLIGFLIFLFYELKRHNKLPIIKSSNNGTIVGNFIKAKYNKYCPTISWED